MGRIKLVLFDMDGLFADLEGGVIRILRREFPWVKIPHPSQRRTFYLDEEIEEKDRHLVREIIAREGFFKNLKPIPGTIEALYRISSVPYVETAICTSPLKEPGFCIAEKYWWIEHLIGEQFVEGAMMMRDKTKAEGDFLLDDKHKITGSRVPSWEHILVDQNHNLHLPTQRRVDLTCESGYKWFYEELLFE